MNPRRPGTVPLAELRHYQIRPHRSPERISERGDFYIRDGWTRDGLDEYHRDGRECCYIVDFVAGEDDRSCQFVLSWSPLRERIIELVLRSGMPVGPCRLVSKPMFDTLNVWAFVGDDKDGKEFDTLGSLPEPEQPSPNPLTL